MEGDLRAAEMLPEKVKNLYGAEDQAFFRKAYVFAKRAHEGQTRLSGEPYFLHPYEVASILTDIGMDISTVVAGLFHDIVEDTPVTLEQIRREFGDDIARLVDGVTKVGKVDFLSKEEHQAEYLRKMFMAMASDIRVILVKLADRLHNMRTLKFQSKEKQIEKAKETLEIYAPLAHRLGINAIKWELEDLSLKYIDEKAYHEIADRLKETRNQRREYIDAVIAQIRTLLKKIRVEADIEGRPKHIYSIYNKIYNKHRAFEEVYDLIAVRIVVGTVRDCYAVLGTVHTEWKPIPGRFKDYIAVPKQNMYQSIHTTVLGKDGRPFEVQIRTREMHSTAEYGIAAHWHYKEGSEKDEMDGKLGWLREMLEWQTDTRDSREFMETLKLDFFSDKVYVFTPKGDVKEFVQGATPLDFAYGIHSEIGNRCAGAKVNGKIVPLTYTLKSGDIVEILTSAGSKGPSRDWLKLVRTSQAKSKIRNWFRREMKEENISKGRDMLEKEARRKGYDIKDLFRPEWLKDVYKRYTFSSLDDVYAAVGYGGITTGQVLHRLIEEYSKTGKAIPAKQVERGPGRSAAVGSSGVIVKGYDDMVVRFARCCNPVPGDDIVGYITRGRGVSVHRSDCSNVLGSDFEYGRMIEVGWSEREASSYNVEIQVTGQDRAGLIAEITGALYEMNVPMTSINARTGRNRAALIVIGITISATAQLADVQKRLRSISGVTDVFRLHS